MIKIKTWSNETPLAIVHILKESETDIRITKMEFSKPDFDCKITEDVSCFLIRFMALKIF
ncbi:hypothetical protein BpHYR1_022321 [Brachionus plicatilis]|uniref:Uncharacterized protein n=1 Tax=Brachionus plicatilis TaxID=10195 RepID=A0A3M7S5D3_BRAPC|nr:hypothetical protein BpHYR1_022321 [Brachionus plicatilis]